MIELDKVNKYIDIKTANIEAEICKWEQETQGKFFKWQINKAKEVKGEIDLLNALVAEINELRFSTINHVPIQVLNNPRYQKFINTKCDYRDTILEEILSYFNDYKNTMISNDLESKFSRIMKIEQNLFIHLVCDSIKKYETVKNREE